MFEAAHKDDSRQAYPHLNVFLEMLVALDKPQVSHVHPEIMKDSSYPRRVSQEIAWVFGLERVYEPGDGRFLEIPGYILQKLLLLLLVQPWQYPRVSSNVGVDRRRHGKVNLIVLDKLIEQLVPYHASFMLYSLII